MRGGPHGPPFGSKLAHESGKQVVAVADRTQESAFSSRISLQLHCTLLHGTTRVPAVYGVEQRVRFSGVCGRSARGSALRPARLVLDGLRRLRKPEDKGEAERHDLWERTGAKGREGESSGSVGGAPLPLTADPSASTARLTSTTRATTRRTPCVCVRVQGTGPGGRERARADGVGAALPAAHEEDHVEGNSALQGGLAAWKEGGGEIAC